MATQQNIVRKFDSLYALIEYAQGDTDMTGRRSSRDTDRPEWHGTADFDEAVNLALHGWSDVRPQVDRLTSQLNFQVREVIHTAFQPVYDVQGAMVDVGAYLEGQPECMVDFLPVEQSRVGRVVNVIVQIGVASQVTKDEILARGAAVAALVEALAIAQHSTEIWIESSIKPTQGNKKASYTVLARVKEASERFDLDAFSFALAHPSMLRRIIFSCRERESVSTREYFGISPYGNYGISEKGCLMADEVGATVVVQGMNAHSRERQIDTDPIGWIKTVLSDLGLSEEGQVEE